MIPARHLHPAMRSHSPLRGPVTPARPGFSLIELVVCIGILMILIGLALPALGGSIAAGRLARNLGQIKQLATLVISYTHDYSDVYPLGYTSPFQAAGYWYGPLEKGGYVTGPHEVDPVAVRRGWGVTYTMSLCMVYDPRYMRMGWTVPVDQAVASPVREHQVTYPAHKGLLVQRYERPTPDATAPYFCCTTRWTMPVAMADGSAIAGDYIDFSGGRPVIMKDEIGMPVYSTWGGYLARDR